MYQEKDVESDIYCKCDTPNDFEQFCRDGFWDSSGAFTKDTGITFEDIKGQWFQVVHNRVYLEETIKNFI